MKRIKEEESQRGEGICELGPSKARMVDDKREKEKEPKKVKRGEKGSGWFREREKREREKGQGDKARE